MIETGLCAVTVMYVEVDNRDALEPVLFPGIHSRESDVVEQAESSRAFTAGVMAGRANKGDDPSELSGAERVNTFENAPGCEQGYLIAFSGDRRIEIQVGGCVLCRPFDALDEDGIVYEFELANSRFPGLDRVPADVCSEFTQCLVDRHESLGGFRMP